MAQDWFAQNAPQGSQSTSAPPQANPGADWFAANSPNATPKQDLLSNPNGEGTYAMKGPSGTQMIPFSKVQTAQGSGMQLQGPDAGRFQKDAAASGPDLRATMLSNIQANTQDLTPTGSFFHDHIVAPAVHVANRMGKNLGGMVTDLVAPDVDLSPQAIQAKSDALNASINKPLTPGDVVEGGLNAATNPGVALAPSGGLGTQIRGYAKTAKTNGLGTAALDAAGDIGTAGLLAGVSSTMPKAAQIVSGQNYNTDHAAAFEGAIAPATAMGKNFIPQNVTPEALSPIRDTAARMSQGTPAEQSIVSAATASSTPPLKRFDAYQRIVQGAISDLESQHTPALAQARGVPVDTTPIVQRLQGQISPTMAPADVAAVNELIGRVQQAKTIGDLNKFRQELNIETAPEYRQSQVQAGRSGLSSQATSDLAGWVRNAYYDNLQQATGTDFAPLKRQEANLFQTQESLQNQQAPLAKAEAVYHAPSTVKEKLGNAANVIKDPKTAITQNLLGESPATKVATLLQKSLQDLPDTTQDK